MAEDAQEYGERYGEKPLNSASTALEHFHAVAGVEICFGFTVTNTNASAQFVQMFDGRAEPAANAVPIISAPVQGSSFLTFQWIPGRTFFAGIVLAISSTQGVYTAATGQDCLFDVQYL